MAYDFKLFQNEAAGVVEWLVREYAGLRTGRASPSLLDQVFVVAYGARLPVKQVASVTIEDQRTLRVAPWDRSQIKDIEQAIAQSNLGVSTTPDSSGLRVIFPALTAESRARLIKLAEQRQEQARVSLRRARERVWQDIQEKERSGSFSEDEKFRYRDDLQKIVDETNQTLESLTEKKRHELTQ